MTKTIIVLKGYPRLSETFIAQELLGLEQAGMNLEIVSMRQPTDTRRHPVHDEIKAPVRYLPEYLHDDWPRVIRGFFTCLKHPGFFKVLLPFWRDLRRDWTRHRARRLGQAMVLAAELPSDAGWIHAHFIHTPASVAAYASVISGIPWSCSAHAKDIWTSPGWELKDKLSTARGVVTCTASGFAHLRGLAADQRRVHLSYHGLDLDRFSPFTSQRSSRRGDDPADPLIVLSVGRAVPKKGFDVLLHALALLKNDFSFRLVHVGGGEILADLQALAAKLDLAGMIDWKGALTQGEVLELYRQADVFALACRVTDDGDRDGLPNVLVEACSQGLVCVSTAISGVPELLSDGENGKLVEPENPAALAVALSELMRDPSLRQRLGAAAERRVRQHFDYHTSVSQLDALFRSGWRSET